MRDPVRWVLLALLIFAVYHSYRQGDDLAQVCELTGPHDVSVPHPAGETNRIDIADGMGRAPYVALNLAAEFDSMIAALKHCLRIRNKYAHAYWHDPNQGTELCYVSLEELAKEDDKVRDLKALTFFFIDEPLLLQQEQFFEYTRELIRYINHHGQFNSGAIRQQIFPLPATIAPPPFYVRKA